MGKFNFKYLLLNNWNWWRITRMALAFIFAGVGIYRADSVLILGGVFLFFHALLNACASCVGGSCEWPLDKNGKL